MNCINLNFNNPALQIFFEDQVKIPHTFNPNINSQDEMYLVALENQGTPERATIRYYFNGRRILDATRQAINWHFGSFDAVSSFLDFASGYGRLTRFLIQELPPKKVYISDIYSEAVDFQIQQFGVQGIVSTVNPDQYQVDAKFDAILACSLFSHLPQKTFSLWLKKLYELLTPQGLLMFSVHHRDLLPAHLAIKPSELLFIANSESRSLDVNEYGTTYVGEEFVENAIQDVSHGKASYHRIPQGICGYQDLYLVTPLSNQNFTDFQFSYHPQGRLEHCTISPDGYLHLKGWVSEINPNSQTEKILVFVNGKLVCQEFLMLNSVNPSNPLSWSVSFNASQICLSDIILIKAVNSRGLEWVFEAATLASLIKLAQPGT